MRRKENTLYEVLDQYTGEDVTYQKVTNWYDGTPMNDSKADGVIYKKLITEGVTEYFKRFTKTVTPEMFGAKGDGVTDDTAAIQKAINFCNNGGTLTFGENKTYRLKSVYIPRDGLTIIGNGANIIPDISTGFRIFTLDPVNLLSNGLWAVNGSSVNPATENNVKSVNNFFISGFNIKGKQESAVFVGVLGNANYTFVRNVEISHNEIRGWTGIGFGAIEVRAQADLVSEITGYVRDINIYNNRIENGGWWIGVQLMENYSIGATSIKVKSVDQIPLIEKLENNRYIQIASNEVGSTFESGSTYNASNAYYKVLSYTINGDGLSATVNITSGTFDTTNGFIADATNTGLKANVIKNAWIIPVSGFSDAVLVQLPSFVVTNGSNTITRATSTAIEDGYYRNMYVGMKLAFTSGTIDEYTVTAISGNTVTLDKNTRFTFTSRPILQGRMSQALFFRGDCRNVEIYENTFRCLMYGINLSNGISSKIYYPRQLQNTFNIHHNDIRYCYMSCEFFMGSSFNPFSVSGLNITAGATSFTLPTGTYKYVSKDLNGDGTPEPYLALNATTDANVTASNSYGVGDVVTISGVFGLYRITSIPTDVNTTGIVNIEKYSPDDYIGIAGGFENSVTSSGSMIRNFSILLGANYTVRKLNFENNTMMYNIRNGLAGYHISAFPYEMVIRNNTFKNAERTSLEIGGYKLQVDNNEIIQTIWRGEEDVPGTTSYGSSSAGRNAGTFMLLTAYDVQINNNRLIVEQQPIGSGYSVQVGNISIGEANSYFGVRRRLEISENKFYGVQQRLIFAINPKNIGGLNYPTVVYEDFILRNNIIKFKLASGGASMSQLYGKVNSIYSNTISFDNANLYAKILEQDRPNAEIVNVPISKIYANTIVSTSKIPWGTTNINLYATINDSTISETKITGSPEGLIFGTYGDRYTDESTGNQFVKKTVNGNTGWARLITQTEFDSFSPTYSDTGFTI